MGAKVRVQHNSLDAPERVRPSRLAPLDCESAKDFAHVSIGVRHAWSADQLTKPASQNVAHLMHRNVQVAQHRNALLCVERFRPIEAFCPPRVGTSKHNVGDGALGFLVNAVNLDLVYARRLAGVVPTQPFTGKCEAGFG